MTLDTEESLRDNITRFLDCMGQGSFLWNSEGKYRLLVSYPENETETANLVDSKHSFTEDDIVRESVKITWPRAGERFNHVIVKFDNEFENFKSDTVSWPNLSSSTYSTYLNEDNNIPAHTSLYPDGVVNKFHALAYAEEKVRRSRSSYTISFVTTRKGLTVEPGDIITLQSNNLGLSSAEYIKVESVKINYDFTVEITGYKFDYTTLAWNVEDDIAYSVIRDVDFEIPLPTNVSFSTTASNLGVASGKVTWTGVTGINAPEYIVEGSSNNGTTWFSIGITRSTEIDVVGLKTANYRFSVRTKTTSGRLSSRVTTSDQSITIPAVYESNVLVEISFRNKPSEVDWDSNNETGIDPTTWDYASGGNYFRNNTGDVKALVATVYVGNSELSATDHEDFSYSWMKENSIFTPTTSGASRFSRWVPVTRRKFLQLRLFRVMLVT